MHDDQVPIDLHLAQLLIREQFPEWRDEPVGEVAAGGTTNAIFRIGASLVARFPLRPDDSNGADARLTGEIDAMAEFAAGCPFPAPEHVAIGRPGHGYPLSWSVQTWVPGIVATPTGLADSIAFADDLVTLIRATRAIDTGGRRFAGEGRGGRLPDSDPWLERCFEESVGLLDVDRLRSLWLRLRLLPAVAPDVMSHGDLVPANLLVGVLDDGVLDDGMLEDGVLDDGVPDDGVHLAGVLDTGGFAPADPALDLVAAWHLFDRNVREHLREALGCGPIEWRRGAAWAFQQAMGIVWYYRDSNPAMSRLGRTTLDRILADPDLPAGER